MPNVGFTEILIVLLVALLVFGPKRLPQLGRQIGRAIGEFRRATDDVRGAFSMDIDEQEKAKQPAGDGGTSEATVSAAAAVATAPDAVTAPADGAQVESAAVTSDPAAADALDAQAVADAMALKRDESG